ncbi:PAS domain S-box-containing protein [Desulfacinum hydrothermale DSM 13146]|uniref:histidine kinase n=1 Tax=Desulfacinum hydrothermale DSM 13146 TaxID=1121390 RepID=A0A1W1WYQ5_9BACT|nr:PAS domain S-box protein [Desulfacinum hydrothermale]SMC16757.1 PAS domain S-box-containing protein [Desulfacinum hydrothermale DSM 13146]
MHTRKPVPAHHAHTLNAASYKNLVEKIPAIVYQERLEGARQVFYVSPQADSFLSCRLAESSAGGDFLEECIHPDDLDRVLEIRHRARREGRPIRCEYRLVGTDGRSRWFWDEASVSREPDGSSSFHGVLFDITERKAAEEALLKRDAILEAVAFAAQHFLRSSLSSVSMESILRKLGEATAVSRVYIFQNHLDEEGRFLTSQRYEWAAPGIEPQIHNPDLQNFPWHAGGFSRWVQLMEKGEPVFGRICDFPPSEQPILQAQGILSLVVTPIFVHNDWWGFIGFDDCVRERAWDRAEIEALQIAADMLGAMIARHHLDKEIFEARHALEQRVRQQTQELTEANRRLLEELRERKRAEARLKTSERHYRELYERSLDGYARLDFQQKILQCNTPFARMLGYDRPEEVVGLSCRDLTPERWRDVMERTLREQVLERGFSDLFEKQLRRKDGTLLDVEVRLYLHQDEQGRPDSIWSSMRDISERKAAESERMKAQKLESLGVLAGGIAHDFNNILTGILGYVSLIRQASAVGAPIESRLEELERGCLRAQDLTRQLLTFSKGGSPVKTTGSLSDVIRESAVFTLRGTATECEFSADENLWMTEFDAGQMAQVVQNLVLNAHQAMDEGGVVRLCLSNQEIKRPGPLPLAPGRYVCLSVRDTGCGIPQEQLESIFDPYFSTKPQGSGLGLATAYSIVKKHGGHLAVQSAVGQGTTFTVYLPVAEAREHEDPGPSSPSVPAGSGRILVMDDDPVVRDVLSQMLEHLGFTCDTSCHGQEAVDLYRKALASGYPYDAVILDLTIPGGMGGRRTLQKLRELDPDVRALVSSGYSSDPIMARPHEFGFYGVVAKPYRLEDLARELQRVLSERTG